MKNTESQKTYDYRSTITKIINTLSDSKQSLEIGIISIREILKMAETMLQNSESETSGPEKIKIKEPSRPEIITKKEIRSKSLPEHLQVERLISGFDLYDPTQPHVQLNYHYDELTARKLNIENHDIVKVDYNNTLQRNIPYIKKIVKAVNDPVYFTIMRYCKIEKTENGEFIVKEKYNHQSLKSLNKVLEYYVIPPAVVKKLNIQEGQLIDIGWYRDEPQKISIRLIHYENELVSTPKKQPIKKTTTSTLTTTNTEPETVSTLKFNLRGKHVGIIVGDELRGDLIKKLIQEHHGRLTMIDAFKHSDSANFYNKELRKKFDIVIMVQNQNKHSTSKALNKAAKKYHLNMAIANGLGIQQIERAIYRAVNKYPAYETSANIDYPTL